MASMSRWGFHPLHDDLWQVRLPWASLGWSSARREEGSGPLKPQHQAGSHVSGGPADTQPPPPRRRPGVGVGGQRLSSSSSWETRAQALEGQSPCTAVGSEKIVEGAGPGEMGDWRGDLGAYLPRRGRAGARSPQLHVPVFSP